MNASHENAVVASGETKTAITTPELEVYTHVKIAVEEFKINVNLLVVNIKELIHQVNIRHIISKTKKSTLLLRFR